VEVFESGRSSAKWWVSRGGSDARGRSVNNTMRMQRGSSDRGKVRCAGGCSDRGAMRPIGEAVHVCSMVCATVRSCVAVLRARGAPCNVGGLERSQVLFV
jgi:hypothetical protein